MYHERNKEGEYLQFYTTPFDDRFCFEFVERRAAYCDFGISNASVRVAMFAQWGVANGRTPAARPATMSRHGVLR